MRQRTRRQILTDELRHRPDARPTDLVKALDDVGIDASPDMIVSEIRAIQESLDDEDVKVHPPVCNDCGFEDWDNPANIPSSCPECNSTWIDEPMFTI